MTLVADENIDRFIVERLREYGHDVLWIAEINPTAKDPIVLARAFDGNALLLTKDKDFGELIFRQRLKTTGVLLLRIKSFDLERVCARIQFVLNNSDQSLFSKFSVLSDSTIRMVPLPQEK